MIGEWIEREKRNRVWRRASAGTIAMLMAAAGVCTALTESAAAEAVTTTEFTASGDSVTSVEPAAAEGLSSSMESAGMEQEGDRLLMGINQENYPRVDGSTATLPLSAAIYSLVTGCTQKEADEAIVHSKTTNSWLELIQGEKDLLIVADKNEKVDQALEESQVELEIKPIALDAFVFMTNEGNTVQNLTSEQIVGIYSGEITNWNQLGGEDTEIVAFQRNENAGSQTAMKSLVMKGVPMKDPQKLEIGTMMGLLEAVASYNNAANAIGYSYYYYTDLMCRIPGLHYIAVDGVQPNPQTIQDGEYPYIAKYYAAIRKEEPQGSPARCLYEWMTTRSAQELAADLGYVPLDSAIHVEKPHYEDYAESSLPIGEDECLILQTNEYTIQLLDQDGKTGKQFENAQICGANSLAYGLHAMIWKKSEPLPVKLKTGSPDEYGNDYKAGLYSIENDAWIVEPAYSNMMKLSESVYSEVDLEAGECLIRIDGTVLDRSYNMYYILDNWLYGQDQIRDLEGNLILSLQDGYIHSVKENEETGELMILASVYDQEYHMVLYDSTGNVLWEMPPQMSLMDANGSGITWQDEQGQNIITDWSCSPVLSDENFIELNKQYGLQGRGLILLQRDAKTGSMLVKFTGADANEQIYLCDSYGRIRESFPANYVSPAEALINYYDTSWHNRREEAVYWLYEKNEEGKIRFRELLGGRMIDTDEEWIDCQFMHLSMHQNLIGCYLTDHEAQTEAVYFTDEGRQFARLQGWPQGILVEEDVLLLRLYQDIQSMSGSYYATDGRLLCEDPEGTIWYANSELRCIRNGAYCYLEDAEGKLYRRILCQDEEKDEASMSDFWMN